ncbi:hypothetical protein LTR53_004418 [Teratosphaeriaceae sp. CCFEE 6253]|nr:hypothetical protein LTR53_004418 [Teratosphaeriaceae sp. CCFEE 6253]
MSYIGGTLHRHEDGAEQDSPDRNLECKRRIAKLECSYANTTQLSGIAGRCTECLSTANTRVVLPPAAAKSGSAWNARAGASLFQGLATKRGVPVVASMRQMPTVSPSAVASQLGGLTIDPASTAVANPSEGPGATEMGGGGKVRAAPSTQYSNVTTKFASIYAKLSWLKRKDFAKGDIISLPFHAPNTNPHVDPNDESLAATNFGYVYSKRRMLVVLWIYHEDMFCLPLYSFNRKGIQSKPECLRHEYVSVRNVKDTNFVNQGTHAPIAARHRTKPFSPETAVHITGGVKVGCNEDIAFCGRTTKEGYAQLVKLYEEVSRKAKSEFWKE